ncbi:MAG: DNA-directed RNA polymerase subunit beta' [Candidatus Ornithospirochaeta sp.]|nr:DNA-directed RNA polymerase subunit beta' [Candidatus Ornithospirochaeta sp.]
MSEIQDFSSIRIKLASPEQILAWSYGEVKKPETINYRSLRPERDGLFCERIFGTTKAWECWCGKFKSNRYKGVVCDRCGVEVTDTKVRRERIGHITLAAPVAHIWFYRSTPSIMSYLLDIKRAELMEILSYEKYVVTDPGQDTDLRKFQVLSEDEYYAAYDKYNDGFKAGMGAEAIYDLLKSLDLKALSEELRAQLSAKEEANNKIDNKLLSRIRYCEDFLNSGNKPEWMILKVIPVIPPDLRPMVQLDGGRFATTDLNELYRRVINRNNRLDRLIKIQAPDIIIRNEKRMLQEAVDSLFDNSKTTNPTKGSSKRDLKSLSDVLKGKQGRFRQNLLGKRVDYSGRSVIVVGPELRMHQCGVPAKMALELYKPFIMRRLVQLDIAQNIKRAKNLVETEAPEVWGVLDEVVKEHPVMLNRAPTLHRLGIQAFEPVLVEGKALKLHPLVCHAFNADFDGDQMAIHVPLTQAAQLECWTLMLSTTNLLDPANGKPIAFPSQDMVLGIFYLTKERTDLDPERKVRRYETIAEIEAAIGIGSLTYNEGILYRFKEGLEIVDEKGGSVIADGRSWYHTTPGRVIFNEVIPEGIPYQNYCLGDKQLKKVIGETIKSKKPSIAVQLLDAVKDIGFKYATIFGATIGLSDMIVPEEKKTLIAEAEQKQSVVLNQFHDGQITQEERYNRVIEVWTETNEKLTGVLMDELRKSQHGFNPLFLMADSGARGSKTQIRQLGGMRGLMAKPNGKIIELPIKSNFKEGLSIMEFFISSNGARKGLTDTALKTARAGYLTRKLVDVAQDVVVSEEDCHTINGILTSAVKDGDTVIESLASRISGSCPVEDVLHPFLKDENGMPVILAKANEEISDEVAKAIEDAGVESVLLRTVLTCESAHGVCRKCYGRNLATNRPVEIGEAVGIIAAQSIGQPGTQLTMRTFHVGGTASTSTKENKLSFSYTTIIRDMKGMVIDNNKGSKLFPRKGHISVSKVLQSVDASAEKLYVEPGKAVAKGYPLYRIGGQDVLAEANGRLFENDGKLYVVGSVAEYPVPAGSELFVSVGQVVPADEPLISFDPFSEPIIAEASGVVEDMTDFVEDKTYRKFFNEAGDADIVVVPGAQLGAFRPAVVVKTEAGAINTYQIPGGAYMVVKDKGEYVEAGDIIAKVSKDSATTKDIAGGLPQVDSLFEARHGKISSSNKINPIILSRVTGTIVSVQAGSGNSGSTIVTIRDAFGQLHPHKVYTKDALLLVREGDEVKVGEPLCDEPYTSREVLEVLGENAVLRFLVSEIQKVYRMQGVEINEKHLGIIIRQMLKKVEILRAGDTPFVKMQKVDKNLFDRVNEEAKREGRTPAIGRPILQGVSDAALSVDSFMSAASFLSTTRVLTNAAIAGKKDELRGLKENVVIGHLIPAGTGMRRYRTVHLDEDEKLLELQKEVDKARRERKVETVDDDVDIEELGDMKAEGEIADMDLSPVDEE